MTRLRSCRQYHKEKGRKHSVPFYVDKLGRLRSLLLNVCQFLDVGKVEKSDPWVGTYICGDEWDGATYLVLTAEKEFYRYQQFKMLEKDAYSVDEDGQVTLLEDNGAVLLYAGQRLWYVRDGQTAPYEKMSDQAVFVNVEEEG